MTGSVGIDLDSYLNVTRPKPIKYKTRQEIFDHVVRTLYAQVIPAIKIEFPADQEEPKIEILSFNSSAKTSPIMCFFTREDMKVLTSAFGYVDLQLLTASQVYGAILYMEEMVKPEKDRDLYNLERVDDYLHPLSLSQKEAMQKLLQTLQLRGIERGNLNFLRCLHASYEGWGDYIVKFTNFYSPTSCDDLEFCKTKLYRYFIDDCRRWQLKDSVLHFTP